MGELYEYIDSWNGEKIFIYVVVFILILWFFIKKKIGMNILVAILIAMFTISYLNYRTVTNAYALNKIQNIKKDTILPKLTNETKGHEDIVNFLFSIEDFYMYNPQQYEEMVKYINYFYNLYNVSVIDDQTSSVNYGLMKQYKRDALNALMTIIFSSTDDKRVRDKISASAVVLDDILSHDLDQISYIVDKYVYTNGYNIDTKIIDYGPKAANEYDDMFKPFSYELY